jgi:hypothetical protein
VAGGEEGVVTAADGNFKRLLDEFQAHRRCGLCFGPGDTTISIGKVGVCHSCYSTFNSVGMAVSVAPSAKGNLAKMAADYVADQYSKAKDEYLTRLMKNVKTFVQQERALLPRDTASTKKAYKDQLKEVERARKEPPRRREPDSSYSRSSETSVSIPIGPGCQYCGREGIPASSGRGDTYCSCREDAMSPDERESYNRWIQGMERGGGGNSSGGGYSGRD